MINRLKSWLSDPAVTYRAVGAVIVVWFVLPIFAEPFAWPSTRDWGYFTFLQEVTRKTILEFHQFPLWNPYYFGGAEHLANPQTTILSPATLLTLTFGTVFGLKLGVLMFALIGFFGMFALARHWGADVGPACIAGLMYGCSGWFAQHSGGGHWSFTATNLYPWAVLFYLQSLQRPKKFVLALACSVWVAVHWGIYTIPWLFMILLVVAVGEVIRRKSAKPLGTYFLLGVTTFGVAAIRLLPVLEYVRRFPREVIDFDRCGLDALIYLFLSRQTAREFPGHPWVWPEYANYLGWIPALLILLAIFVKFRRKAFFWTGAVIFLSFYFGNWGIPAPYSLLKQLPVFENLRVSSRYTLLALFFMVPAAALALTTLLQKWRTHWPGGWQGRAAVLLPALIIIAIIVDPIDFNRRQFEQSFHLPEPDDKVSPTFVQKSGGPWRMFAYPRSNQGSVIGIEESPIPRSGALRIDAAYQHLLTVEDVGTSEQTYWSPNELRFYVNTPVANQLVINQNFRKEWRVSGGRKIENHRGMLAVTLPPGEHRVTLRYLPDTFVIGSTISLLTILLVIIWYVKQRNTDLKLRAGDTPASAPA